MRKLLPIIVAFLVCLAGGWSLYQTQVDRGKSARAAAFLDLEALPGGDAGYRTWVRDCQDRVGTLDGWRVKLASLEKTQGESKAWQELIDVYKNYKAKIEPELVSYKTVVSDENLKAVLNAQEAHNKAIEAINKPARSKEWSARVGMLKSYSESRERYDEALARFKNQPKGGGGERK